MGDDPSPERFHLADGLVQVLTLRHLVADRPDLLADVDPDDVGTLLRHPDRVRTTLAASGAGDERNLTVELPHVFSMCLDGRTVRGSQWSKAGGVCGRP